MEELNTVGGIQTNPYGRTEVSVYVRSLEALGANQDRWNQSSPLGLGPRASKALDSKALELQNAFAEGVGLGLGPEWPSGPRWIRVDR